MKLESMQNNMSFVSNFMQQNFDAKSVAARSVIKDWVYQVFVSSLLVQNMIGDPENIGTIDENVTLSFISQKRYLMEKFSEEIKQLSEKEKDNVTEAERFFFEMLQKYIKKEQKRTADYTEFCHKHSNHISIFKSHDFDAVKEFISLLNNYILNEMSNRKSNGQSFESRQRYFTSFLMTIFRSTFESVVCNQGLSHKEATKMATDFIQMWGKNL